MTYQLYRNTTLGNSLQESLDELIQSQQITPQLALKVLLQFDKAIIQHWRRGLGTVNFRGSLNTNRFCNNVWTFVLNDVEFREVTELIKVDKVGIPGWRSGLAPAFGPGCDPGDPGSKSHVRLSGAWSLLLPLPVSLPLSLSV
uniref:Transcription initiation factor IIA gamma chain n=1 Tax=Canis lupus familiaris TaxID=9615 RepID=A0A8I3PF49_CANLF